MLVRAAKKCLKDTDSRYKESNDVFLLVQGLEHCIEILQTYAEINDKPVSWVNQHPIVACYMDRMVINTALLEPKVQRDFVIRLSEGIV